MRILHVVSTVAPRYGGPSVAVRGMVSALADLGHDVTVATTTADGPTDLTVECERPIQQWGAELWYFRRSLPGEWHMSAGMSRWLRRNVSSFDVVHGHGIFSYHTIATGRATRASKVPYIIRPLGMLSEYSRAQRSWKKKPYFALIERRNLEDAAAIHVTSEAERDGVASLGYGGKAHVIPLGVDVAPARRRNARSGPIELVVLARLHPGKGIELLFDALELMTSANAAPNVRLNVIGSGDPQYEALLRARAARSPLAALVRFSGHLDGDAKADALDQADIFVLPSSHENFGIAVAEAMASGLPVVISPEVALSVAVREANAGLVVPRDAEALASAIEALRDDPERRAAMGDRARELAETRFSWRQCARALTELYAAVSRASPQRASISR